MNVLQRILDRAKEHPKHIVLPEGTDERILVAGVRAATEGLAKITLLGDPAEISGKAHSLGLSLKAIELIDPRSPVLLESLADLYQQLRHRKRMKSDEALSQAQRPLCFADLLVRSGKADGVVAGATHTTADVVRNAIRIIGPNPASKLVSSFFLMLLCEPFHVRKGSLIFTDCGLVVEPNDAELAQIALAAAASARNLLMTEPKVAMLSFSTSKSAHHPRVNHVINATRLLKQLAPTLAVDGEVQVDAALVDTVANKKITNSVVHGQANVLVFPNLDAGNIGYKLVERLGGAKAIGPLLQGLNRQANDLSRGCSAEDVYHVIAVTVVQSQALQCFS